MKFFYLVLCLLGIALPYGAFIPWILENGLNISLLVKEATDSKISAFAWLDVIASAIVLFGFIFYDGKRLKIKKLWLPVVDTLSVGVSLGLPLFLLMREKHLENTDNLNRA